MKRITTILVGLALLALGGLAIFVYANRPSDQEQIQMALDEAVRAARNGEPGPVIDFISGRASLDGESGASRGEIGKYIMRSKPDVEILQKKPLIDGDKATIMSPVKVTARILTMEQTFELGQVRIDLEKESATQWGIFPTTKWRVVSVQTGERNSRELIGQ